MSLFVMKKSQSFYRLYTLGFLTFLLTNGCKKEPNPSLPLAAYLGGRYELEKIITPSRTIMPKTAGYQEDMSLSNDSQGQYITYYRNDTLHFEAAIGPKPIESDQKEKSLIYKVGSSGYLKIYLLFNAFNVVESISTSAIMTTYSVQADTVRSYYTLTNLEPRKRE
jgi:hypothetical protein